MDSGEDEGPLLTRVMSTPEAGYYLLAVLDAELNPVSYRLVGVDDLVGRTLFDSPTEARAQNR